jgi:hypothetical protein
LLNNYQVVEHRLDGDGLSCDFDVDGKDFSVGTLQLDDGHLGGTEEVQR